MPLSAVGTFTDPEDYAAAIRARHAEVTIIRRGQFRAKLTKVELHCCGCSGCLTTYGFAYSLRSEPRQPKSEVAGNSFRGPAALHDSLEQDGPFLLIRSRRNWVSIA